MKMNKTKQLMLMVITASLAACQSTSQQFNGQTGYQIEQQTASNATLIYTLASKQNANREMQKLQDACQQTLGNTKVYTINIIDSQEIIANNTQALVPTNVALGTRTTFGFSNTPDMSKNNEAYSAQQVTETRPSTLKVVRYTCS